MNILALLRAPQFSPNSVEKDRAILAAVAGRLGLKGHRVDLMDEAEWVALSPASATDFVFSMGRLPETLARLKCLPPEIVINSPDSVRLCQNRLLLTKAMKRAGTPLPPSEGSHGYWLKRADACAQGAGDVVFAANEQEKEERLEEMKQRGITQILTQAHVKGDLVKFYGVAGTGFFRHFYPTDDGLTKFSDEQHNGTAHHYSFSLQQLQREADQLAMAIRLSVYGGDCIVRPDGSFCLIDFNDWPSFSRCRDEAAEAIASLL